MQNRWWDEYEEVGTQRPTAQSSYGRVQGNPDPRRQIDITRGQQQIDQGPVDMHGGQLRNTRTQQEIEEAARQAAREAGRPDAAHLFDQENTLRQRFDGNEAAQNYHTVMPMFASAMRAADNPVGDMQIITAWAKTYDPVGSVREGDVETANQAQSMIDRIRSTTSNWTGDGRLLPEVRENFIREIRNRASSYGDQYNRLRLQYREMAGQYGLDPSRILPPHPGQDVQQLEADLLGRSVRNWDGTTGPAPRQPRTQRVAPGMSRGVGEPEIQVGRGMYEGMPVEEWLLRNERGANAQDGWSGRDVLNATNPLFGGLYQAGRAAFGRETADAAVRGAQDTGTFSLSDEISAGIRSAVGGGSYQSQLDQERAVNRYDEQNNAGARIAGQVAGGFALPFPATGLLRQAGTGAALGAAYGFGSGEDMQSRVAGAGLGAGVGAAGGAAAGYLTRQRPPSNIDELVDPITGRLNQPLENARPAERMAAAQQYGIDLPLGSAGDRTAAILERGLDNLPASAGLMNDSRRAVGEQVDQALQDVAGRFGNARNLEAGGTAAQQGARNWIQRAQGVSERDAVRLGVPADRGVVGRAYDAIPISRNTDASLNNTRATLDELTSAFSSNPELAATMQNRQLAAYRDALSTGGLSWNDLKALRSRIGAEIGEARFSDGPTRDQLRALYGALSEDMRSTAAAQGPRALRAFERANNINAQVEQRIEGALTRLLGDNARNSPEAAGAAIQAIARSGRGSANIQMLTAMRNSMRKGNEWNEVASSMISLMGQPANSAGREFDPQVFVRSYADMSEQARHLLFGDGGRAELRKALDGFVAVSQRLAGSNALRNTSNTAPVAIGAGTIGVVAAKVGGALTDPGTALAALFGLGATAGANYAMGRLWTSPQFVRWATGYTRLARTGSANGLRSHIGRLSGMAARNPAIAQDLTGFQQLLMRAINDNAPMAGRVAASPNERPDQQQRR
jgi:hypothetical protein